MCHKCSAAVHVGGLRFLAPRETLSFPVQLQNEVGSHLGRTLHCFTQDGKTCCQRCDLSHVDYHAQQARFKIGWLQTFGAHKPDVRIFQEVRQPLLLSQVVALGLAQAQAQASCDAVAEQARKRSLTPRPPARPLGAPKLDPVGGGSVPRLRSSVGPRLRTEVCTTNYI